MHVIDQASASASPIAGVAHATWAAGDEGLRQLSVWRQSLAPGAATPPHRHGCDEVVLCLAGHGEVHGDAGSRPFGAGQTVVLPAQRLHQIVCTGAQPLELVAVFAATPVATLLPDGSALVLPWRS